MGCFKKKKAASSLAPGDKYHKNPQGGHRHDTAPNGGDSNRSNLTRANNNSQFSHNGISSSGGTTSLPQQDLQQQPYAEDDVDHHHHQAHQLQLINSGGSPYYHHHYYQSSSVGSSSVTSSSQHHHHPHHQVVAHLTYHPPPHLVYNSSSSGSGGSTGNGSHFVIDGSNGGGAVEGSSNNKYYYYNSHYYPREDGVEEDPDQIFTVASTQDKEMMGRVGEDMYPPGSPASVGGGSGLFKSKSGSIPASSSPQTRGFRDTFISSMSPPLHAHSAESSPLHKSSSATTANRDLHHHDRFNSSANNLTTTASGKQENNKKWTFGGLFRRNKSQKSGSNPSNNNSIGDNGARSVSPHNSNTNSPAKINNNYYHGTGSSPLITTAPSTASPAPSSSAGISIDPSAGGGVGGGQSENSTAFRTTHHHNTPKFVNAESQTRAKGKLSESDISTCDSDFELSHLHHDNPPEPAPQENKGGSGYKQNFLVRRLSRRREKAAAKKKATAAVVVEESTAASGAHHSTNNSLGNGLASSHHHGYLDVPQQMKRRVGSSPDSLNNSTSEPWPSWETTKKPQLLQSQLQAVQQQHHHQHLQNYSSNGSLSLSHEGSNGNHLSNGGSKSTRVAAKEAVKARAIARRESFLNDSSSSEEDDDEERSRSSLQGSFSSLNSRNRRQKAFNMQQAQFQQQRHLFPPTTTGGGVSCASPSSPMPVPMDYRSSMSPNLNRRLMMMGGGGGAPGSPKWEARVIYQQENISENNQPVVFRLPRNERSHNNGGVATTNASTSMSNPSQMSQNNGDQSFIMATEMISEDQHVVTAGLKVPFVQVQNQSPPQQHQYAAQQQQQLGGGGSQNQQRNNNGQLIYADEPVQYANVGNGVRGRSVTPYTFNNGGGGNVNVIGPHGPIHHASPTPPPPPRRDFSRAAVTYANNPNFYRPMSCSYLDAYANQIQNLQNFGEQQQQQQPVMRQQSPMIFNGNYVYPPQQQQHQYQYQGQDGGMNGLVNHSTTPPVHNFDAQMPPSQPDVDNLRHPPLIRSPSEPPAIRIEKARRSSSNNSPVKRLLSSPMPSGGNGENMESASGKSVVTSKLGFPVRRLQQQQQQGHNNKLTGPQSPIHLRASEFWRKKESEVTGTSPVGNNQKKYLNRIRSADSSPLPIPKMRKSPGVIAASNESISSLSSFSENAASPGPPKNSSSPIISQAVKTQLGVKVVAPLRAQISKTPNPQQLTYGNNNKDKENNNSSGGQQSAVERLKVRIPSAPDGISKTTTSGGATTTATNPPSSSSPPGSGGESSSSNNNNNKESNNNPIRALIELNNGKTPGKNLEDALNELEDMYKSLRLSDEDLLDRAERRDLPTPHQELRDAPLIPIPQAYHRFEHLGSVESLGTGSGSSGTNYTSQSTGMPGGESGRVRAPPLRRSARPDAVSDDMANRRLAYPDGKPLDPRVVVSKTGSYMARAPAFSPCTSPCPPETSYPLAFLGYDEPDLTFDDVSFRNYKRANAIRIIEPQPPFGIPLGPITPAPPNDYLHSKPSESYRPIFGSLKTPDVINDDIAFRNLRKDLGHEHNSSSPKDWTPRLFSPTREQTVFNYPKVKDTKKLRAIRSLSANITHMIPPRSGARDSPTNYHYFQQQQQFNREFGKWSSYSDLHRRASAGSPGGAARASTYLQPSWVEQIEKVQTSTETLTDHRNSGRFSTAILDPPEHWERKFPKKTVDLTPPIYDPTKPRRPWTDIILESFEKEKQIELERLAEAERLANEMSTTMPSANNNVEGRSELEQPQEDDDDDDVFMDASSEHKSRELSSQPYLESNRLPSSLPPLLPGQKTRRGSWVEPTTRSSSTSAFYASQDGGFSQDKRRKSWSDLPKGIDSCSDATAAAAIASGGTPNASCSASSNLFNPLPPPKKVRQINLEAFNNRENQEGKAVQPSDKTSPSKIHGEDELNELMDQLLKDADTCGGGTGGPANSSPSSSLEGKRVESGRRDEQLNAESLPSAISSPVSPLSGATTQDKSISTTVNVPEKEMKMDGGAPSSSSLEEKSCKQDLSCTIVGIIPKHQSASHQQNSCAGGGDRNNGKVEQPTTSPQQIITTPVKSEMRKVFKIDNNGKGNVDRENAPPKEESTITTSNKKSGGDSLSVDPVVGSNTKRSGGRPASSIDELIESINESLPELEASVGLSIAGSGHGGGGGGDGNGKSNGSSSASGSPASSIPSPSPGSPTPVLSLSVKKESSSGNNVATTGPVSNSAFPVPAKRHHLPKAEEALYENLPLRADSAARTEDRGGNDERRSSSTPSSIRKGSSDDGGGGGESPYRHQLSSGKVPELTGSGRVHDHHNDEELDNEEEEGQHSSSHQLSSLSSNDSSEVNSPREQECYDKSNIRDNIKTDQVDQQTCSPSSTSIPLNKRSLSSSSSDAFTKTTDNTRQASSNKETNGSGGSSGQASGQILRKKSEELNNGFSNERQGDYTGTSGPSPGVEQPRISQHPRLISRTGSQIDIPVRETTRITNSSSSKATTSSSSSLAEETTKHKEQRQQPPVANSPLAFTSSTSSVPTTATAKKCASSSVLATTATAASAAEASASETGTGMSFLRNNFPFFRNASSRSRSQSVVSDVSRSSETGDSKKEKDKSYRRKSHLNRAFTDEPVPDNNYSIDLTPKSSKPTSQEVSSLENSAMEETNLQRSSKPVVKLHPTIPAVLTAAKPNSPSVSLKPLSRNGSSRTVESTPSPVPGSNSSIGKVQQAAEQNNKRGSSVVKKDSFSDAEGVCFIKKMLQKESDRDRAAAAAAGNKHQNSSTSAGNGSSAGYNLKKSPSAGNQSYWSKFSSSQSAFLRKLFDKPKNSEASMNLKAAGESKHVNVGKTSVEESGVVKELEADDVGDPVVGFSVAEKASFFMKLENEQRFSKWRKNSVDLGSSSGIGSVSNQNPSAISVNAGSKEFRPRLRHMTQPVTPTEVTDITPLVNLASNTDNQSRNLLEFGSQPRIWGTCYSSLGNCMTDSSSDMISKENPSKLPKSSYKDCDDTHNFEPMAVTGSLRERVSKFDEISTRKMEPLQYSSVVPTPTVKSYSLTRRSRNTHTQDHESSLGGFPMYHSASAIINSTPPKSSNAKSTIGAAQSSSSSSFSEAASRNECAKFLPVINNHSSQRGHHHESFESNGRRGSASDLEMSGAHQSPKLFRSEKVRSMMIVSRGGRHQYDADNLSEDGEVSSGGQEVAEIICRSYENSPVFRKKNWRAQKQVHSNFTKEIWRRCGNYENWNQRAYTSQPQQPQLPVLQTFTATTNVIEVTTAAPPTLPPIAPSPPATSNLLQILTVLSSSNDELSESKPKTKKQRQGHKHVVGSSDSMPPAHPGQHNHCPSHIEPKANTTTKSNPATKDNNMSPAVVGSEIFVSVPHPEDEAFQSFFCSVKSYSQVTHYPGIPAMDTSSNEQIHHPYNNDSQSITNDGSNSLTNGHLPDSGTEEGLDISSVRRESDLLVMKKNIPTAKRKSNGKYKNPLRALAARMDFRQQGYTQVHNNTVQCSSDVDVTT